MRSNFICQLITVEATTQPVARTAIVQHVYQMRLALGAIKTLPPVAMTIQIPVSFAPDYLELIAAWMKIYALSMKHAADVQRLRVVIVVGVMECAYWETIRVLRMLQ